MFSRFSSSLARSLIRPGSLRPLLISGLPATVGKPSVQRLQMVQGIHTSQKAALNSLATLGGQNQQIPLLPSGLGKMGLIALLAGGSVVKCDENESKAQSGAPDGESNKEVRTIVWTGAHLDVELGRCSNPIHRLFDSLKGVERRGKFKYGLLYARLNGQGKKTCSDGGTKEGEFKNGVLHGQGKKTCSDGTTMEGEFSDGELNGRGKVALANGTIYEGEFKDNKLNGQGKLMFSCGTTMEGEFKDNKLNGQGKQTYSDGSVIEGEFKDGDLNGKGKQTFPSGTIYEGEFKDNKLNGQGKQTFDDGTIYEGEFKDNKLNGPGKVALANGVTYEGEFRDGEPNGQGKITLANGATFEGDFKDGKLNGKGKQTFPSGTIYEGEFKDDVLHGQGKKTFDDGTTIEGEFRGGFPVIRENFLVSPNKMEKDCLNRLYWLLLDKAEGGFQEEVVNTMLRQLLDQHEQLLSYESIEEYITTGSNKNCILNVRRGSHAFLLGIKDIGQGQYELSLYDSSGYLGHRTTCIKRSVSREKLFGVLRELHSKNKHKEFVDEFRKNDNLTYIACNKEQKTQVSDNCTLDCWLAYLKHNLSDQEFHKAKAALFLKTREFFETEINNTDSGSISALKELEELKDLAQAKYDRREPRIKNSPTKFTIVKGKVNKGGLYGQGKKTYSDGTTIEGDFKDGKLIQGKMVLPYSLATIEGEFKNFMLNGQGKVTFDDGNIYEGEFKDGKPNGQVKCTEYFLWYVPFTYDLEFKDGIPIKGWHPYKRWLVNQ